LLQVAEASRNVSHEMKRKGLGEGVRDSSSINVSFDIAVTVSQESNSDVKGGLQVLNAVLLGGEKEKSSKAENVSRIKLELPLKITGAKIQPTQIG